MHPALRAPRAVELHAEHVVVPFVVHGAGAPAGLEHLAIALGCHVRVGDDGGSLQGGRELVLERPPHVGVAVGHAGKLGPGGVLYFRAVAREQHAQAGARAVAELVVDPPERIAVARFADLGVDQVRHLVEVAAADCREPLAPAVGEAVRGEAAQVEQAESQFVVGVCRRPQRLGLDHRAHAIAVSRRESAGQHVEAAQDARVEHAGRAQQQAQVERLVQRQSVEHDERLVTLAAAHVREARQSVAGGAGQAMHRLERVLGEPRQRFYLLLRQEGVDVGRIGRQRVAARGNDDLLERR